MTEKMVELRECPFCGGEAKLWDGDWASSDHGIICTMCEVTLDPFSFETIDGETSEQYAARAWNTRPATQDAKVERLVEALENLMNACYEADLHEELSEFVDGSLLDAAEIALAEFRAEGK